MLARALLVAPLLLIADGCLGAHQTVQYYLRVPSSMVCPDGAPVKVFQDPRCDHGICGFTCAPTRWLDQPCKDEGGAASAAPRLQ